MGATVEKRRSPERVNADTNEMRRCVISHTANHFNNIDVICEYQNGDSNLEFNAIFCLTCNMFAMKKKTTHTTPCLHIRHHCCNLVISLNPACKPESYLALASTMISDIDCLIFLPTLWILQMQINLLSSPMLQLRGYHLINKIL